MADSSRKRPPKKSKSSNSLAKAAKTKRQSATVRRGKEDPERTLLSEPEPGDPRYSPSTPDVLGEKLVKMKLISRQQLFTAMNESYTKGRSLREALVSLGFIDEDKLREFGL